MRLVLQRANGDCGICALATLLEQSYEDVYIAAARIERVSRGRNGIMLKRLIAVGKLLGVSLRLKRHARMDEDEGVLAVNWIEPKGHPFTGHLVTMAYGIVADPADGVILPVDEYLTRYKATAGSFLELQ